MNNTALMNQLSPLLELLEEDGVNELSINQPGQIIVQTATGKRFVDSGYTMMGLQSLAVLIATNTNQTVSAQSPLLSASLPGGERVQIVCPPATKAGQFGLSIRKPTIRQFSLDDYEASGAFANIEATQGHEPIVELALENLRDAGQIQDCLKLAIEARKNILISGGTSSGKTTFANALIGLIDVEDRIITVEDVSEIVVPHDDHLGLICSKGGQGVSNVTAKDLLEASLRLNPDRIFISELRGEEAFYFLRAANSGHPGSISTLHASTAAGAIDQLVLMIQQAGTNLSEDAIRGFIVKSVDVIIQFNWNKQTGLRELTELYLKPVDQQ